MVFLSEIISFSASVVPGLNRVREDILQEEDGPILRHGMQRLEGLKIHFPTNSEQWLNQDALAWKYEKFQREA